MNEQLDKDVKRVLKVYDEMKLVKSPDFRVVRTSNGGGKLNVVLLMYCNFRDTAPPYLGKDSPLFMQFKKNIEDKFKGRIKDIHYTSQLAVSVVVTLHRHPVNS